MQQNEIHVKTFLGQLKKSMLSICPPILIFASQGLRFGSPFSPPLADLEYIFEDSRFNISLVTATSTRIQSEDVLHGAHVIREM